MTIEDWKTVEQTAKILRVSERWVRELLATGQLQGRRIGKTIIIHVDEIERYQKSRR